VHVARQKAAVEGGQRGKLHYYENEGGGGVVTSSFCHWGLLLGE
jgi:hypothetical protein